MGNQGKNEEKRSVADDRQSQATSAADAPELPEVYHFWNGDEFTGQVSAQVDKERMVMEGKGTYKTSDGDTYEGIWEDDSLREATRITYRDRSVFSGSLEEMLLMGHGKYAFKENVQVEGQFLDNGLVGRVHLTEPEQHAWRAEARPGEAFLLFYPLHPFWQSVLGLPFKFQLFYGELEEENEGEGVPNFSFL